MQAVRPHPEQGRGGPSGLRIDGDGHLIEGAASEFRIEDRTGGASGYEYRRAQQLALVGRPHGSQDMGFPQSPDHKGQQDQDSDHEQQAQATYPLLSMSKRRQRSAHVQLSPRPIGFGSADDCRICLPNPGAGSGTRAILPLRACLTTATLRLQLHPQVIELLELCGRQKARELLAGRGRNAIALGDHGLAQGAATEGFAVLL